MNHVDEFHAGNEIG